MNVNEIRNPASPTQVPKQSSKRTVGKSFDEQLQKVPAQSSVQAKETPAALTSPEREYFEQLFPNAAEEIRTYNPYRSNGAKAPMKVGTLVDRRG